MLLRAKRLVIINQGFSSPTTWAKTLLQKLAQNSTYLSLMIEVNTLAFLPSTRDNPQRFPIYFGPSGQKASRFEGQTPLNSWSSNVDIVCNLFNSFLNHANCKTPSFNMWWYSQEVRTLPIGGSKEKRSVYLISWDHVTQSKEARGLGFRPMHQANSAFLTKLRLRLLTERDKLWWSRVLPTKYYIGRCDMDMFETKQDCSNTWRAY